MSDPVLFYFDFSSPYGYFAAQKIDETVADFGRRVTWKPIMLGAAMKETGNVLLVDQPIKGDYCRRDWNRLARYMEVPWTMPDKFPIATLAAARAFYWLDDGDPALLDVPLEEGMVFTVEPWYYNHDLQISVFVEDVILVTEDGAQVLTAGLGRTPEQLEAMIR